MKDSSQSKAESVWTRLNHHLFGFDYFIAHRHLDGAPYARELHRRLTSPGIGFDCFLDTKHYEAGGSLTALQTKALRKTSRLLVITTPAAHGSPHVCAEVNEFNQFHRKVIPIGTETTLSSKHNPDSPLLKIIPHLPDSICLLESSEQILSSPSANTIAKLVNDFDEERRSTARLRALQAVALALLTLSALAGLGFWQASRQRNLAQDEVARRTALLKEVSQSEVAKSLELAQLKQPFKVLPHLQRALRFDPGNIQAATLAATVVRHWSATQSPTESIPLKDEVEAAAFNPGASLLAIAHRSGQLRMVSTAPTLHEKWSVQVGGLESEKLSFDPSGRFLVGLHLGGVTLWNADTGVPEWILSPSGSNQVNQALVIDAGRTVITSTRGSRICRYRHASMLEIEDSFECGFEPHVLARDPGRQLLAAAGPSESKRGEVLILGESPLHEIHRRFTPSDPIEMCFDDSGTFLAAICEDREVVVFHLGEPGLEPWISGRLNYSPIQPRLRYSPGDRQFLALDGTQLIRIQMGLRTVTNTGPREVQSAVQNYEISDDGRLALLTYREGFAVLWNLKGNHEHFSWAFPEDPVLGAWFAPNSKEVVTLSQTGRLSKWPASTSECRDWLLDTQAGRRCVGIRFEKDGSILGIGDDGRLIRWTDDRQRQGYVVTNLARKISSAQFSPDGSHFSVSLEGEQLEIFDNAGRLSTASPFAIPAKIKSSGMHEKGKRIAISTVDGALNVYDWNGKRLWGRADHDTRIAHTLSFTRDGHFLLASSSWLNGGMECFDAESGSTITAFKIRSKGWIGHSVDPQGNYILVADTKAGTTRVTTYDPATLTVMTNWITSELHRPLTAVWWSNVVGLVSQNGIEFWRADTGRSISFHPVAFPDAMSIDISGKYLAYCGEFAGTRLGEISPAARPPSPEITSTLQFVTGVELLDSDTYRLLAPEAWLATKANLPEPARSTHGSHDFVELLQWKSIPPLGRTISPGLAMTADEAIRQLVSSGTEDDLNQAYRFDPFNPVVRVALAAFEEDPVIREWHLRNEKDRISHDPKGCDLAARVMLAKDRRQEATNLAALAQSSRPQLPQAKPLAEELGIPDKK